MAGNVSLATTNTAAVQNILRRYGQNAVVRAKGVVTRSTDRMYDTAQSLCPVDTGFMKSRMRKAVSDNGLSGRVGFRAEDFPGEFYPIFTEFGTRFMAAQPCVFPASAAERPRFRRELKEALSPSRGAQPPRR